MGSPQHPSRDCWRCSTPGATIVSDRDLLRRVALRQWHLRGGSRSFTRDGDTGCTRAPRDHRRACRSSSASRCCGTPFQSVEVFIFVIGILFLVQGIMTFIAAFSTKRGRNWRILSGLLGIVCRDRRPHLAHLVGRDARASSPGSGWSSSASCRSSWASSFGELARPKTHQLGGGTGQAPRPRPDQSSDLTSSACVLSCRARRRPGAHDARFRPRRTPVSSLRRSSVVERAAVNRLVVGSSPTAGATPPSFDLQRGARGVDRLGHRASPVRSGRRARRSGRLAIYPDPPMLGRRRTWQGIHRGSESGASGWSMAGPVARAGEMLVRGERRARHVPVIGGRRS